MNVHVIYMYACNNNNNNNNDHDKLCLKCYQIAVVIQLNQRDRQLRIDIFA